MQSLYGQVANGRKAGFRDFCKEKALGMENWSHLKPVCVCECVCVRERDCVSESH